MTGTLSAIDIEAYHCVSLIEATESLSPFPLFEESTLVPRDPHIVALMINSLNGTDYDGADIVSAMNIVNDLPVEARREMDSHALLGLDIEPGTSYEYEINFDGPEEDDDEDDVEEADFEYVDSETDISRKRQKESQDDLRYENIQPGYYQWTGAK
jgi:hypothetical protein